MKNDFCKILVSKIKNKFYLKNKITLHEPVLIVWIKN